jgi:CxxC motif-containing protein (DUF1111 family)
MAIAVGAAVIAGGAVLAQERLRDARHLAKLHPSTPAHVPGAVPAFGDPLLGLAQTEQAAFDAGREEFESIETPASGLGPIFNNNSCAACHLLQASGGAGTLTVTRFGRRLPDGSFDPLTALDGTLLHAKAIDPAVAEHIPPEANVIAQRITTPLFGLGLIEAIPDDTLRALAQRRKPDGIGGRTAEITDIVDGSQRVGRLGWKAQHASVLGFAADAYVNEMGISNRFFPHDIAPNGNQALLAQYDKVPDPEDTVDPATGKADIDRAADFVRLLAPPPLARPDADALAGAFVFERLQCAACHVPVLLTGDSPVSALAHVPARLFSDLLLHDMGALGDGIAQGAASGREMKTAPLWGLRGRGPYLHDGRAATVRDAIRAHDGEAAGAARAFGQLGDDDVRKLLAFLATI